MPYSWHTKHFTIVAILTCIEGIDDQQLRHSPLNTIDHCPLINNVVDDFIQLYGKCEKAKICARKCTHLIQFNVDYDGDDNDNKYE